jgi:hypothetical protein
MLQYSARIVYNAATNLDCQCYERVNTVLMASCTHNRIYDGLCI